MIFDKFKIDTTNAFREVLAWDGNEDSAEPALLVGKNLTDNDYPWIVIKNGESEDFKYIKFLPRKGIIDSVITGDILIDQGGDRRKVLVAFTDVCILSAENEFNEAGSNYTVKELLEEGWEIEGAPLEELVHLTIQDISDGKGKGIDPSLIELLNYSK